MHPRERPPMRRLLSACVCLVVCACTSSETATAPPPTPTAPATVQPTAVRRPLSQAARPTPAGTAVLATPPAPQPTAVATLAPPPRPMLDGLLDGLLPENTSATFAV